MVNFLTENEKAIILQLINLWSKSNEEIFQTILNRNIAISEAELSDKPQGQDTNLSKSKEFFAFPLTVSSGILGNMYLAFSRDGLARLLDLIIGGDGSSPMTEFDDLHLNVLEESINQIAGTLESILSDNLMRHINVRLGKPDPAHRQMFQNWDMVYSSHSLKIEGIPDTTFEVLFPRDFCHELVAQMEEAARLTPAPAAGPAATPAAFHTTQGGSSMYRKATFPQLNTSQGDNGEPKIDLIMDIPLELTVVLGKTSINIKELVEMGPGSILELEKLAGEPVELLVNDRLVGYGEVIVIEENFGIRVIDVVKSGAGGFHGGKKK